MIKFENTEVSGWEHAIRGMRNPLNSWDKSDSYKGESDYFENCAYCTVGKFFVGENDIELMQKLRNAGTDHRKFMRMITVYVDITAPLYWWKEFDTYKVGTVANSCSTMHKIADKKFNLEDFSYEQLIKDGAEFEVPVSSDGYSLCPMGVLADLINVLNGCRKEYLNTKNKRYWWQLIQLLPTSYNQKRTVMLNYEVLANIYKSRRNHKLDEWSIGFMDWIKSLPYSELITGAEQ